MGPKTRANHPIPFCIRTSICEPQNDGCMGCVPLYRNYKQKENVSRPNLSTTNNNNIGLSRKKGNNGGTSNNDKGE